MDLLPVARLVTHLVPPATHPAPLPSSHPRAVRYLLPYLRGQPPSYPLEQPRHRAATTDDQRAPTHRRQDVAFAGHQGPLDPVARACELPSPPTFAHAHS